MRKIILITIFVISSGFLFSQSFDGGLLVGVIASHTTGTYVGDAPGSYNNGSLFNKSFSKPGITVGFFTNLFFTPRSALDFEISYTQKGSRKIPKSNDTIPGQVYETRLNLHYITIPIHYKFIASNRVTMFVGPNLGILIGHKHVQDYMDYSYMYDDLSKLDLAIDLGAEIYIIDQLILNLKYSATFFLTPIRSYNNSNTWSYGPFNKLFWQKGQCNQLFAISIRWVFMGNRDFSLR
ncbi:MAG: PorT family protein [Bacteroidales bacterium]|jgi:hypothetical protein|nr:PorT family protein [Bacteroidales bacterium]